MLHSLNNESRRKKLSWQPPKRNTGPTPSPRPSRRAARPRRASRESPSLVLPRDDLLPRGRRSARRLGELRVGARPCASSTRRSTTRASSTTSLERAVPAGDDVERRGLDRRRATARSHGAAHGAAHALARAPRRSARRADRLGAPRRHACTIDVDRDAIADADLHRAEDLVNDVIRSDVTVRALFPTAEELAAMDLRRAPKVDGGRAHHRRRGLRPHAVRRHALHAHRADRPRARRGIERYKGKLRDRASTRRGARSPTRARRRDALVALAQKLTCGPLDVGNAVAKLQSDLKARMDLLGSTRGELLDLLADEDPRGAPARPDRDHDRARRPNDGRRRHAPLARRQAHGFAPRRRRDLHVSRRRRRARRRPARLQRDVRLRRLAQRDGAANPVGAEAEGPSAPKAVCRKARRSHNVVERS